MESNEVLTLRAMAWQRAKGELNAMLATYWPTTGAVGAGAPPEEPTPHTAMEERVREFIGQVESTLQREPF